MAGDVSPVDVISHIPVICESKDVPYAFVRSRMELGIAAQTKKPTSVVLLSEPKDKNEKSLQKYNRLLQRVRKFNPYF
jgi:H/ACA ribonucleoprotein complex subunit 2